MQVTLSSGMVVDVRGMRLGDQAAFGTALDEQGLAGAFTTILAACTERVVDPGPFPGVVDGDGNVDWSKAYSGDRLEAMLAVRMESYPDGNHYPIKVRCAACGSKAAEEEHVIDLRAIPEGDLLHVSLSPDVCERVAANVPPIACTVDGKRVSVLLPTGQTEAKAEALANGPDADIMTLRMQIAEVADVHANDVHRWLSDLAISDFEVLEDAIDEAQGGVDVLVDLACKRAGHPLQVAVPFGAEFWRPRSKIRARRAARMAAARSGASSTG